MANHTKTNALEPHYPSYGKSSDMLSSERLSANEIYPVRQASAALSIFFQQMKLPELDDLLSKLIAPSGKKSFLVFKNNKYYNIPTEKIAYFHIKHEVSIMMCFDQQEFYVNYSLEQIQQLLPEYQFFRLNRQYLINFHAVKEVEHYFARKLLVNLSIPVKDLLLVSKEKVTEFLHWLDNR